MSDDKQAAKTQNLGAVLGLDVGGVNTRATLFGISEGKYRALGSMPAVSTRAKGFHIGAGAAQALQDLQAAVEYTFLDESGGLLMPVDRIGRGVDRVALVVSAGTRVRTGLLGVSTAGSLKAGRVLCDSLPIQPVCEMNLVDLGDEQRCIEALIRDRPDILVVTGGEDTGTAAAIERWIEVARTVCHLLPQSLRPMILYAGNPALEEIARRRLEAVTQLRFSANLQPLYGQFDLLPAQSILEGEILRHWKRELNGLAGLCDLTMDLCGINVRGLERMVRFLNCEMARSVALTKSNQPEQDAETSQPDPSKRVKTGVLAVDLGGMYTTVSVDHDGCCGSLVQDKFPEIADPGTGSAKLGEDSRAIYELAGKGVTPDAVDRFLYNHALLPAWLPETQEDLALSQAFAGVRLRKALVKLADNYDWFKYHPERGLMGHYERIILSGAAVTQAPSPQGLLLTLLDGFQPWGITTFVVDRHHLLPQLGKIAEIEPVLPVHTLNTAAFENLATVVSVAGSAKLGDLHKEKTALTVRVETDSGKVHTVEVRSGYLIRLEIQPTDPAVLELQPHPSMDVGFGGRGRGGRLHVTGGLMGVVIDARGRPLPHDADPSKRFEARQAWLRALGEDGD